MRLDEFEAGNTTDSTNPLSSEVNSLILRLDASKIKKIKFDTFINELNNVLNVPIDSSDEQQATNIKSLISNSGKADLSGEYIIMDYTAPEDSSESDVEKIAMKNIRDKS